MRIEKEIDNMYIHTFEVSAILTNELFYNIQNDIKTNDKDKWKAKKNGMEYWGLSDKGIFINMHTTKKKGYYGYSLTYRISARRVMENDNYVGLFDTNNYYSLEEKVNKLLKNKSSNFPKLKNCKLKRIDFCINAVLDNQEQVKAYIKTSKRAKLPGSLSEYKIYDKTAKRTKPTKDDFTAYSSEYIAVSIYNKYAEMKKQKKSVFPKSEIDRAKNIVRIEIRCMEDKVKALKKKYDIDTIQDFMEYGDIIGTSLYQYYLPKMFGEGEICTLKRALDRIEMSGLKQENKELMREFIEQANSDRSASAAYSAFKSAFGKKETKRILYMFDLIATNYVTVTNSDAKLFDCGYIPTPIELFEEFKNQI